MTWIIVKYRRGVRTEDRVTKEFPTQREAERIANRKNDALEQLGALDIIRWVVEAKDA